ncbi:glycoside hydrolase family 28 protein [Enterococcus sp. DIV0800]|uniref:glycoside hydrolase family 28 protein n=1 Tax=unclassified Enterococcus TaxID=2608891 RepID=UPI003D300CD5
MEIKKAVYLITDFGAIPDRDEVQTATIQKCIDRCRDAGGGEVIIPAGTFLVGSLRLYSDITLRLQAGAVLLGSRDLIDYYDFQVPSTIGYLQDPYYKKLWNLPDYYFYGIITAFEAENIKIIGEPGSAINGQDTFDENGEEKFRGPMGILLSKINNLHLEGYCFENSANWSHTLDGCNEVVIRNVTIRAGHDGFNLHHSKAISISDCHLECGDDCFAGYDIKNLLVKNCYLNTSCNGMRIGGTGLLFKQCVFHGPGKYPHLSEGTHYTHAIFKYYSIESDVIHEDAGDIKFSDCMIQDADKFLAYEFGNKDLIQNNRPLRDLSFENVSISGIRQTSIFKGSGERVTLFLKNVQLAFDPEIPFLRIDESVRLDFQQVTFLQPTVIEMGNGKTLQFEGTVTAKLDSRS